MLEEQEKAGIGDEEEDSVDREHCVIKRARTSCSSSIRFISQ